MSHSIAEDTRVLVRRARRRRFLGYGLALLVIAALAIVVGEELDHNLHALERRLTHLGAWAPILFVLGMGLLTSLFVPETLFALMAGALFGLGRGTLLLACGSYLGAVMQFGLGRHLLSGLTHKLVARRPALAGVLLAVRKEQLRLQLLLRLTPLNPALVSYALGATGVRPGPFLLACTACAPYWFAEVYLGFAGRHMAERARQGSDAAWIDDGLVAIGLVALVGVIALVSRAAQRALSAATSTAVLA